MATKQGNAALGKQKAGWPAIAIGVVALVAFLAWYGIRSFGPETIPKPPEAFAHDQWMDKIAKETGGDASKLKPEDSMKLNKETFGHAQEALGAWAKQRGFAK